MNTFSPFITKTNVIALIFGLFTIITLAYTFGFIGHTHKAHPIGTSTDTEVHVHSDIKVYIGDTRIRFTEPQYQSTPAETHHASLHFHDGNDEVVHRHADGVTLAEFFESIGFSLTNDCFTLDNGTSHCSNEKEELMLLVNGERTTNVTEYIIKEEDRILVYFGSPTNPNIGEYVGSVTEMACMYSGTCPEKGTPPTESCGLTCEVADLAKTESEGVLHTLKEWMAWW